MKKIFGIILTIALLTASANAATLCADKIKSDVKEIILNDFSQKTSADVDIKITMLPFQCLTLPDGKISYVLINSNEDINLTSRQIKRVNILVDNNIQRTINIPIEVKIYDEVLVASDLISREQPIDFTKVTFKKINIADKSNFVVTRDMMKKEMIAKKDYKDGDYIDKRFIKVKPDVVKNSQVRIILNSGNGLQISIDGIAKADGTIGEYVTVENKMYNKVYSAKVIGENRVEVNI